MQYIFLTSSSGAGGGGGNEDLSILRSNAFFFPPTDLAFLPMIRIGAECYFPNGRLIRLAGYAERARGGCLSADVREEAWSVL